MTAGRLAGLAAAAIVVLWGGILAIAATERHLPDAQQWYGHAAVSLWTATIGLMIAWAGFAALHRHQVSLGSLRRLVAGVVAVASVVTVATVATVANIFDAVGAYPSLETFHDRVNAVAAPAGWVLLVSLLVLVIVASAAGLRASSGQPARKRQV